MAPRPDGRRAWIDGSAAVPVRAVSAARTCGGEAGGVIGRDTSGECRPVRGRQARRSTVTVRPRRGVSGRPWTVVACGGGWGGLFERCAAAVDVRTHTAPNRLVLCERLCAQAYSSVVGVRCTRCCTGNCCSW
ncbi:hypothetical protein BS78_09G189700 [Paspalum vaginatum]|nr:hypothetical protein BS78_09G189700 [Paspalum vaginatum]